MFKYLTSCFIFIYFTAFSFSQELNCEVVVNAEQTGSSNMSVFTTLENSLTEFVNQTKWTDSEYKNFERIQCSMFINILKVEGNSFSGTIQVQSSRPVYGSTMISPVFNFKDENFNFTYLEFEPLEYNPNQFNSNLVSVVSFYVYTILGLDKATFEAGGGTKFFEEANQIVSTAQQSNQSGWKASGGSNSRFTLNSNLLSNSYVGYRNAMYTYHRKGLDVMHRKVEEGKQNIATALLELNTMNTSRPNSLLVRTFFDAKAHEVEQIFTGGPKIPTEKVIEALRAMAPTFSNNWNILQ